MNTQLDTYRFDGRTKEEFNRDQKEGHRRQEIVKKGFAKFLEQQTGVKPEVQDNGCDNSGEYLEAHQVSAEADLVVNGQLIEVKTQFSRTFSEEIWLKKDHTDRMVRDGAHILFAFGDFDTGDIIFTLLSNDYIKQIVKFADVDYPAKFDYRKAVYVLSPKDMPWWKRLPID